jgi:DNA-binding GntR family transcriptional regulator
VGPKAGIAEMSDPVRREVLSDGVYRKIRAHLLSDGVEPGSRLSIDALAKRYQVSQTPVREALARLESEGLVVKRALAGYSATLPLDLKGFDDLFEMRHLLEPSAAGHAAMIATDEELTALESILQAMSVSAPNDDVARYREFASLDEQFHKMIATMSGNTLLADAIDRLQVHKHFYKMYYYEQGSTDNAMDEHQRVLTALSDHDPISATRAMTDHIEQSRLRLRPTYVTGDERDL